MRASVLQMLVDERLGTLGPWHELVGGWRAAGVSWEVAARRLRELCKLQADDGLTGETVRRWAVAHLHATVRAPDDAAI